MITANNQHGNKYWKYLNCSSESRFLSVILIFFWNAGDGSCKRLRHKKQNLRLLFPLINSIVCHNTDWCLKIRNLNLQIKSGLETERSNDKVTKSLLDWFPTRNKNIWCHHMKRSSGFISHFFFFFLSKSLHPKWGLNSRPQGQELCPLLTEPARRFSGLISRKKDNNTLPV